ncbi:MAG: nicotinamidase [Candidatus Pacebacteria bacterium]|nr:nicotinamidase [Candidatus Paceibacterota bacterium]
MKEAKKALLIIDVQNDFCPGGSLAVTDGDRVVEPLNNMIKLARENGWLVIASRDWHPKDTAHFKEFGGIWPAHCIEGTGGAKFKHGLLFPEKTVIINKGTSKKDDGYSPFEGTDTVLDLPLAQILNIKGIADIFIGGLATDYCVKAGVLDALKNGYGVYLLEDAIKAVNLKPDDGANAIEEMQKAGAIITTTEEVTNETR